MPVAPDLTLIRDTATRQVFEQLSLSGVDTGGVQFALRAGSVNLPFATGAGAATPVTVSHGIGSSPVAVLVMQNGMGGPSPIVAQVDTINATTFRLYGEFRTGTTAGAINVSFGWIAIG